MVMGVFSIRIRKMLTKAVPYLRQVVATGSFGELQGDG